MMTGFEIIDISQPVASGTACFPGDVPFSRQITVDYQASGVINLSAFTMSPHVGTHADAPVHVRGELAQPNVQAPTIGQMPLGPFVGPALVLDVSPWHEAITWSKVEPLLAAYPHLPSRILFRTQAHNDAHRFQPPYAWPDATLVQELVRRGVVLIGIDTPSVDHVDSKTLDTHHALLEAGMAWLENLDLTQAPPQAPDAAFPFLVALPLKMMELEASPVRAVLLRS
jgi:arylformamidase